MNTSRVIIVLIILALVGLGGWWWYTHKGTAQEQLTGGDSTSTSTNQVQGQDVTVGTGTAATPGSIVTLEYVGALEDGTVFDSSEIQGQPLVFTLGVDPIIPGFQIGVNGMKVGGERILSIPPALAYGTEGLTSASGTVIVPGNATLLFQVKLLDVSAATNSATDTE